MSSAYLTIKELTEAVGETVSPRMVRHYHQIGLLPLPERSPSNYRLYTDRDVQRLKQIVALKQQGFQLAHIRKLLDANPADETTETLLPQLRRQYQAIIQQITQLRQTASALERLLGRDRQCQATQVEAIARLKQLESDAYTHLHGLDDLWALAADIEAHPDGFQESLQWLLPDLSDRSEIEVDLLSRLVLACGDVSLVSFVRLSNDAIAVSRDGLKAGCQIVVDAPTIAAALDQTRLEHLGCESTTLIDDPHIATATEAEQAFWQQQSWHNRLHSCQKGCILVIGYAPSVLLSVCEAIQQQIIQPALVIGMPIGFSHAPIAKRKLMQSNIPFITIEGTLGGGLLAATTLNALATSLIEKPDCHCYLNKKQG